MGVNILKKINWLPPNFVLKNELEVTLVLISVTHTRYHLLKCWASINNAIDDNKKTPQGSAVRRSTLLPENDIYKDKCHILSCFYPSVSLNVCF